MHPAISNELATARNADLRQAQGDTVGRAAAHLPFTPPQPGRNWIPVSLRRVGRQRFGTQLWTLLHAQDLLDGPATHPHHRYLHAQAARLSERQ